MKLTLELTDEVVAALRVDLRVSTEDYKAIVHVSGDSPGLDYALRIVRVRKILGMSMKFQDACDDYVPNDDCVVCDSGFD